MIRPPSLFVGPFIIVMAGAIGLAKQTTRLPQDQLRGRLALAGTCVCSSLASFVEASLGQAAYDARLCQSIPRLALVGQPMMLAFARVNPLVAR